MSFGRLATRSAPGYLRNGGKTTVECLRNVCYLTENRPSTADEVLEEVLFMEDEREPISKVSPWGLATRVPLENREFPV